MDGLEFYVPFNSISVISVQWKSEHELLSRFRKNLISNRLKILRVKNILGENLKIGWV